MEWITIKEAAQMVDRAPATLRGAIRKHKANEDDRICFDYKETFHGNKKTWFVEKASVLRFFGINEENVDKRTTTGSEPAGSVSLSCRAKIG